MVPYEVPDQVSGSRFRIIVPDKDFGKALETKCIRFWDHDLGLRFWIMVPDQDSGLSFRTKFLDQDSGSRFRISTVKFLYVVHITS